MTPDPSALVRAFVDPERREELLGDLEEIGRRRGALRAWYDAASVCVHEARLQRQALVAVAGAAALAAALLAAVSLAAPPYRTVTASDPAGPFTLAFQGPRVVAATLDGARVPAPRLVQTARELVIRGGDGPRDLHIRLLPDGRIFWHARSATPAPTPAPAPAPAPAPSLPSSN